MGKKLILCHITKDYLRQWKNVQNFQIMLFSGKESNNNKVYVSQSFENLGVLQIINLNIFILEQDLS